MSQDDGRFHRHGELGRGATASVYLADDQERGHVVALKVLHPHLVGDPSARRRLEREVKAAALVQHEAALVPYELHELPAGTALSMPFHPGETLSARVADRGALPPEEVRRMGVRLASALVVAHRAGVLHRDLSPGNVLLTDADDAALTDFGLARVGEAHTATATGMLGTVGYAAPELLEGRRGDPRSDLYALGAVLYLALTGRPAFPGESAVAALRTQLDGRFTPVRDLVPSCPKGLARTVEALLEADPGRRPQGAPDVVDLLEGRIPASAPPARVLEASSSAPEGSWRVEVRERDGDKGRREKLRAAAEKAPGSDRWDALGQALSQRIETGLRSLVGLPEQATAPPEERLADALRAQGFDVDPLALIEPRFVLVQGVDEATARGLAAQANELGFRAKANEGDTPARKLPSTGWLWGLAVILFLFVPRIDWWIFPVMAFVQIGLKQALSAGMLAMKGTELPPVGIRRTQATLAEPEAPPAPPDAGDRALTALDALEEALRHADLPTAALSDLRSTHRELRAHAEATVAVLRRPQQDPAALDGEVAQLERRRSRLHALRSAGQAHDPDELSRVEQALAARQESLVAADRAEGERVAAMAQLVEIASTADRVRFDLSAGARADVGQATERLRRDARALAAARSELAQRGRS